VRNRDLLKRIDRHLERADQRWASIDEEIRLTREEIRLSREQRQEHAEMHADLRVFTRDMMSRMERVTQQHGAAMRDLREESLAHRQALLRLLDRFDHPGDSPSAA